MNEIPEYELIEEGKPPFGIGSTDGAIDYKVYTPNARHGSESCSWCVMRFIKGKYPSWILGEYDPAFNAFSGSDDSEIVQQMVKNACQQVYESLLPEDYDREEANRHWQRVRGMAESGVEKAEELNR